MLPLKFVSFPSLESFFNKCLKLFKLNNLNLFYQLFISNSLNKVTNKKYILFHILFDKNSELFINVCVYFERTKNADLLLNLFLNA